ncbi:hypothetical protein [Haloarcula litorea]|uniref:hypothetical protein n=1 Tax=Haloarcula litorea TaxID=3032579 RepID=UPI0023E78A38|nr:hypothetical protein [Halomicroarcula sp. GDY20]
MSDPVRGELDEVDDGPEYDHLFRRRVSSLASLAAGTARRKTWAKRRPLAPLAAGGEG